ncbi:hypothetical protein B0H14DRAFT_3858764 [Mycena olivaceomarginata]|nr:hypothetical protein B0H14DRAFT_3858764 [Mycena olivaceomarginata]
MDYYYEVIHETIDLIVSLCYSAAAAEGVFDEPLPKGIALRFPRQGAHRATKNVQQPRGDERAAGELPGWASWLVEFDQLPVEYDCGADMLSSIDHMKSHLKRK